MTDIKEPINTTSDGVVCENPEKSVVGQKLGGGGGHSPTAITPLLTGIQMDLVFPNILSRSCFINNEMRWQENIVRNNNVCHISYCVGTS